MALAKEKIHFNGQCSVLYFTYGTMHAIMILYSAIFSCNAVDLNVWNQFTCCCLLFFKLKEMYIQSMVCLVCIHTVIIYKRFIHTGKG